MAAIALAYLGESDRSWPKLVRIVAVAMVVFAGAQLFYYVSWLWLYSWPIFVSPVVNAPKISGFDIALQLPTSLADAVMLYGAICFLRSLPSGRKILSVGISLYVIVTVVFLLLYDPWFYFTKLKGNNSTWLYWQLTNSLMRGFENCVLPAAAFAILRLPAVQRTVNIESEAEEAGER